MKCHLTRLVLTFALLREIAQSEFHMQQINRNEVIINTASTYCQIITYHIIWNTIISVINNLNEQFCNEKAETGLKYNLTRLVLTLYRCKISKRNFK